MLNGPSLNMLFGDTRPKLLNLLEVYILRLWLLLVASACLLTTLLCLLSLLLSVDIL